MKKILISKWYLCYSVLVAFYVVVTIVIGSTDNGEGGLFTAVLNAPSLLLIQFIGYRELDSFFPFPPTVTFAMFLIVGWLIIGALLGWIFVKIKNRFNKSNSNI